MTDSFRFWLLVPLRSMEKLILSSAQCTCFREKPDDQGPNPGGRTFPAVGFDNLWNKSQMPIGFKIVKGYDSKRDIILSIKHHVIPIIALNPRRSKDKRKRRADYILPVKRNSAEWNRYYDMRVAVERVLSRLKEELGLCNLKLRSLERVEVHFAICLIAMTAIASTAAATGFGQLALCIEPWRYYG